ncbi:MAG TPA: TIM-barrel domain-containing protein, partial [Solirubrobacteraceae bacterium]
ARIAAILSALASLAAPATARAAATIGADQVVVQGEGARVVVDRAPFRMTFTDGVGRAVLREVAAPAAPAPGAEGSADPAPTGLTNPPEREQYLPLAFEVGGERSLQYPGALYQGNMLTSAQGGVVHHARTVTDARPAGEGARLELATTDPTRPISLELVPDGAGAIRVRATLANAAGVASFADAFDSPADEAFHGFGGRHNTLDQRGQDFVNWVEQENAGSSFEPGTSQAPGSGGSTYMFPGGPHGAYYVQSLFVSSRPYGFLLGGTELSRWRMASERPDAWRVAIAAPLLDYTVAVGDGPEAIRALTAITGRQRVPPAYATGANLKRGVHILNEDPESYRAKIEDDLKAIESRDLPIEAYSYEGWRALDPAFVRRVNDRLRARGIHPFGYLRGFVSDDGPFFDPPPIFDQARDNGYLARTPDGQAPYLYISSAPAGVIDFTNPEAVKWWQGRVREMLDLGFDGFMNDFGEQVVADMRFHDGRTGAQVHNENPILQFRATREEVDRYERAHPGREIFFYTRAGFSGRPGATAFENANFPGDETTDYQRSSGLPSLATDMLNRSVGGAYGYTTDIGGYFDGNAQAQQDLDAELFVRWSEWSALTPFFRVHNSCCDQGTRMPYSFDDATLARWRALADLHDEARPYTRALWEQAARTGMPVVRPLWLAFPGDREAAAQDQEWLLGPDVLVAPVVRKGVDSRRVYFPAGCWQHGATGQRFDGGASHEVAAPLGQLPYFFRCGQRPFEKAGGGGVGLPSARRCRSKRVFRIHLRRKLRRAKVSVDGRRVRVRRRSGRLTARVDLRGKRRGTYRVRVVGFTRRGRRLTGVRTYHTCRSRRSHRGRAHRRG